jgi:hypothetical protein
MLVMSTYSTYRDGSNGFHEDEGNTSHSSVWHVGETVKKLYWYWISKSMAYSDEMKEVF